MAKRTRYPKRSKARPAARQVTRTEADAASASIVRRPDVLDTPTASDQEVPARSSSTLTEAEFEQAERLEAELVAKEREAIAESLRRKARTDEHSLGASGDHNSPLSVRAAHEYAYVARDVKRITLTAGLMIGILAVLYILTNVLGVITL
jgi:hypothetical protein